MEKCGLTSQLNILICKKEQIFQRINRLYDASKNISNFESRRNENFLNDSETIDELRTKFESIIDDINNITLKMDPKAQPDYQPLDAFEDLYSCVKRVRNKILAFCDSRSASKMPAPVLKLAPLQIPTFDGRTENWAVFYESFKSNVHLNENLTDSQRVQYLVSKLTHNALHFTAGIVPNGETYNIIWGNLVRKYQDKRALGTHYLNNILELKNCSNNAVSLNNFIEKFSASIAALKQIGIPDLTDFILLHCALKKMDSQTLQNFEMSLQSKNVEIPTYTQFIEFIQYQVKVLERSNNNSSSHTNAKPKTQNSNQRNTYKTFVTQTGHSSNNASTTPCELCKSTEHSQLYNCKKFIETKTPLERFK